MTLKSALAELLARPASLQAADAMPRHPEFELATRRSQIIRVRVLLSVIPILALLMLARFFFTRQTEGFFQLFSLLMAFAAYQALVLVAAQRADRQDRSLPVWFWQLNAVLESLFPAVSMFAIMYSGVVDPHRVIVAPLVYGFPLGIILCILTLRPSIPLLSGIASALVYLALLLYSRWAFPSHTDDPLPLSVLLMAPPYLLILGLVGAGVAMRIRSHALAEIKETARSESFEHELFVAGRIQSGLLPTSTPAMGDFQVAGWSRPADHAGGDYYDWQILPGGRVAMVLADVSGHGIGPAVLAALCRSYLRASLLHHSSLSDAVSSVNTLVRDDLPDGWFITMAVAVVHPEKHEAELISAGHGPIFQYQAATGRVESLPADVPPLGVSMELNIAQARVLSFEPGDLLALVSDGFHEWPTPGNERYGLERLGQTLASHAAKEPQEIISNMLAEVEAFAKGSPQPDDLTALVLKLK